MRLFVLLIVLYSSPLWAYQWSLQVTDSNYELKNINLGNEEYKPLLPKTSWRCWFGATETKDGLESKSIRCNYSVNPTGEFKTWLACSPKRPYGEAKFELFDEKKDLTFQMLVICRE